MVTCGAFRLALPLQVPESAISTERFLDGVPFRGRTRGESVRGGSRVKIEGKAPYPFGPKLDSKVGPRKSPKNKPPPEAPLGRLLAPSAAILAPNMSKRVPKGNPNRGPKRS